MIKEFKDFIARGNMLDMAVGIVMGIAFGKIISSLVQDIIMPPIGLLLGGVDFSNLYVNLTGGTYKSLAAAQAAGATTINYGLFINTIIDFLVVAFAIFMVVKAANRMRPAPPADTTTCGFCLSTIPVGATRCPHCTSELAAKA